MKAKGIVTGALTGAGCLAVEHLIAFSGFPFSTFLFFLLFTALSPVSLLIFKLIHKHIFTVDLALLTGISANIAWTFLFMVEITLTKGLTFYEIAAISFFSFLFGFVFTAITSNFFAKVEAKNRE